MKKILIMVILLGSYLSALDIVECKNIYINYSTNFNSAYKLFDSEDYKKSLTKLKISDRFLKEFKNEKCLEKYKDENNLFKDFNKLLERNVELLNITNTMIKLERENKKDNHVKKYL